MEIEGTIRKKKVDGRRRAFMLDNGDWVSTFFNDETDPEFKDALESLDEGDRALFTVVKNQKGFLNIQSVEPIIQTEDDCSDNPSPTQKSGKQNNGDIFGYSCNAANVAGGICQALIAKAKSADEFSQGTFEEIYDNVMMCHNKTRKGE